MFAGLVLEGITGTGKSTVFRAIQSTPVGESRLFLSQVYTLRLASAADGEGLLDQTATYLEAMHAWYARSEFAERTDGRGDFLFAFESFHYYIALEHIPTQRHEGLVRAFDARLAKVGARLAALWVRPESIMENCVRLPLQHRGQGWRSFVRRYGSTEAEIAAYYLERQEAFFALIDHAAMPSARIDTTDRDWGRVAADVMALLPRSA
jgi:hypothetical protein